MNQKTVPEAFPPGDDIREELEARGWAQLDLAAIVDRPPNVVSDIITGRRPISPEIANLLGKAFGTSAQFWMNLQTAYDLAITESKQDDAIERRSKLFEKAPIRDMQKRGWLEESSSVDILETQVCQFFEIKSINSDMRFSYAARKSTDYAISNPAQIAWLMRAKKLAKALNIERPFSERSFEALLNDLVVLRFEPEEIRHIPKLLSKHGIRFLIVEHLPKTKIDGACFWLDKRSPVIVLSLRYDRIDWFWHSLVHELAHIKNRDGSLDNEMFSEKDVISPAEPAIEKEANAFAVHFLINQTELEDFICRHDPTYSKNSIIGFSRMIGVHPGVVVGQLQHPSRGRIPYSHFRPLLVRVRHIITETALTDGWGRTISL